MPTQEPHRPSNWCTRFSPLVALAALAFATLDASAQMQERTPPPSPKARVEQQVGMTKFSVEYSSPAVRGRAVWGDLVPNDQPWRTGANERTKLTASHDFIFGDRPLPAGSYALDTIPGKDTWTVALNRDTEAWGAAPFDARKDVVRVTAKPEDVPFRERLVFLFSNTTEYSSHLDLEWEKLRISVPIGSAGARRSPPASPR